MTSDKALSADHKRIYLSSTCGGVCERMWCEDDNGPCEECGTPWTEYVLASDHATLQSENDALRAQVAVFRQIAVGLDDDDRDYERINNLAGCENNHWRTQLKLALGNLPASAAAWLKEREADKSRIKELEGREGPFND